MIKITKELLSEWFDEVNKGLKKKKWVTLLINISYHISFGKTK